MARQHTISHEFATPAGPISISYTVDDSRLSTDKAESSISEEGASYKAAVKECHEVLDEAGIPSAKGVECFDQPTCISGLGHRVRNLRNWYRNAIITINALKHPEVFSTLPKEAQDIINNTSRSH